MWWSDFTEPHLKLEAKKEAKGRVIEDGRLYCCHEMVKDRGAETQEKQQEPAVTPGAVTGLPPGGRARGVWDRPAASVEWAQESKAGGQGQARAPRGALQTPGDVRTPGPDVRDRARTGKLSHLEPCGSEGCCRVG